MQYRDPLPTSADVAAYIRFLLKRSKNPYDNNITYINRVLFFAYASALFFGDRLCDESPRWSEYGFTFNNTIIAFHSQKKAMGSYPLCTLDRFPTTQQESIRKYVESGLLVCKDTTPENLVKYQKMIPRWIIEDNRRKVVDAENRYFYPCCLTDRELLEWFTSSTVFDLSELKESHPEKTPPLLDRNTEV